jgi:hypothetical protein
MRSFKALWRLAINRREDRPASRAGDNTSSAGQELPARDRNDITAALLSLEPPTRTLQ